MCQKQCFIFEQGVLNYVLYSFIYIIRSNLVATYNLAETTPPQSLACLTQCYSLISAEHYEKISHRQTFKQPNLFTRSIQSACPSEECYRFTFVHTTLLPSWAPGSSVHHHCLHLDPILKIDLHCTPYLLLKTKHIVKNSLVESWDWTILERS